MGDGMRLTPDQKAWFRGKRVLILGGAGFIGSTLARLLVPSGAQLTLLDGFLPQTGANAANLAGLSGSVRVIRQVLGWDDAGYEALVTDQDVIVNLAAQAGHQASMETPHVDLAINTAVPLAILEACRRVNPAAIILFASTRQVYGRPDYLPVDEHHPLRPVDVNGIHKIAAESYHRLYHQVYGLKTISLRLTNVYGPRLRIKDARQTFLGIWLRRVIEDEPFELWGGAQRRDLAYVDDVAFALIAAMMTPAIQGGIFNIGADDVISLADLAALLIRAAGSGSFTHHEFPVERAKIDIGDYWTDDRAFRTATGWGPKVDLEAGLARSLAYFRTYRTDYL